MKRLIKKTINPLNKIAIGDILKNDINFRLDRYNEDYILTINLINENKQKDSYWTFDSEITNELDDNVIGYIIWTQDDNMLEVDTLEVKKGYNDTNIAMYLLKEFEQNILTPFFNTYGQDAKIKAIFQNERLKKIIDKYLENKQINYDTTLVAEDGSMYKNPESSLLNEILKCNEVYVLETSIDIYYKTGFPDKIDLERIKPEIVYDYFDDKKIFIVNKNLINKYKNIILDGNIHELYVSKNDIINSINTTYNYEKWIIRNQQSLDYHLNMEVE